jgi:M6 family metalloprotease-like protein
LTSFRLTGRSRVRWLLIAALPVALLLWSGYVRGGLVSPKNGGSLPASYHRLTRERKSAFTVKRGWVHKMRRADRLGSPERSIAAYTPGGVTPGGGVLSGRLVLPAVLGLYSDVARPPFNAGTLQRALFDGRIGRKTIGAYYREVSRGLFDVSGVVYDWVRLENPESYYAGPWGGTSPGTDKTGEMIREILDHLDPSVDFGAYDNDGEDGVPNSGDDDGYVDVLLVIHPTRGGECGNLTHIWSHSWSYSEWPASGGEPYRTGDAAAGGGVVLIDDYIIAPALSCDRDRDRVIEIGVYCHEIGHVLGLPDLYDPNGGSKGIGHWGLMGTGSWNTPESPAHLCGWSKDQLGWVDRIEIDWHERSIDLEPVQDGGTVVTLPLPYTRFTRRPETSLSGEYALVCGYSTEESENRNWAEVGYGNAWRESMVRRFRRTGDGPITLTFDAVIDAEESYDFGYVLLETAVTADTLAGYTGRGRMTGEAIELGDCLLHGTSDFVLRFLFVSDDTESNEDGYYDSAFGYGYAVDNVSVQGGGIDYFSGFEEDAGGWRADSPPAEYFLVENRRRQGFDRHIPGEGILIWHAENSIAYGLFGNSGGYTDRQARGLVLEEADGRYDLLAGDNMGDTGDPFPGRSGNTAFGRATNPDSRSNGGSRTPVEISAIGGGVRATARYEGGMPAPAVVSVRPDTVDQSAGGTVVLDIRGSSILSGASCALSRGGEAVHPDTTVWLGGTRLLASFPVYELTVGEWDLTVVSGDGRAVTAGGPVMVRSVYREARVANGRDALTVEWELEGTMNIGGSRLYRSGGGGAYTLIADVPVPDRDAIFRHRDRSVLSGVDYAYSIVTELEGGVEETLDLPGPYRIPDLPFIADQNVPNPFREETTISFFVPRPMRLSVGLYDAAGRRVYSWGEQRYDRGTQRIVWAPDKGAIRAGVYFCVFRSGRMERAVKMVLIR